MPGFPVTSEPCKFISTDQQPSSLDAGVQLSVEEKLVGEQTFSDFCKPVEFYNILRHRTPIFIPRCLEYRREARRKKRIQMTVMLSWSDEETQNVFPLYIGLARCDPNNEDADILTFRGSSGIDGNNKIKAEFALWDVNKLAVEAASGSLFLLFFTTEGNSNSSSRVNASPGPSDPTCHESEKICLYGKISFQSIYMAWDSSPNFCWGQRAEIMTTLDLLPCILKYDVLNKGTTIAIQDLQNSEIVSTSKNVQIKIFAEEFTAMKKSLNYTDVSIDLPSASPSSASSSSSSWVNWSKEGKVIFYYRYFDNKLKRKEVTADFSCPLCSLKCVSYKGLRCHLLASHDIFNYEFSASENCLAVNVTLKHDIWRFEIIGDDVDPRKQTFTLCGKQFTQTGPEVACFEEVQGADSPGLAKNADSLVLAKEPIFAIYIDLPVIPIDTNPPILASDTDSPLIDIDVDRPALAVDEDPPIAMDADPPIAADADQLLLAMNVDPSGLAMDVDPPAAAIDADPPAAATDADPPASATDADPPASATDADTPVSAIDTHPPTIDTNADPLLKKADENSATISGVANENVVSNPDPDCVSPISEHDHGTPAVLQVDNAAKKPAERFDVQSIARLTKRQFYHSQKGQPMSFEEVLSDCDSEKEVDDKVDEIEERWRLSLHDVSNEEKELMFLWNTFVRKQNVRVDAHIHWACRAFSLLHSRQLNESRELSWCWTMFRLKLFNFGLIDAKVMDECSIIIEKYKESNPEIYTDNIKSILLTPPKNNRRKKVVT